MHQKGFCIMDYGLAASIILFLLLLCVDMFFYGFGSAITSLNKKELERRAQEEKDKKTLRLQQIVEDPSEYVNTVQLVATGINVTVGAMYFAFWMNRLREFLGKFSETQGYLTGMPAAVIGRVAAVLAMLILLYILLAFGVLLPKRLASRVPERWAYTCISTIWCVTRLLKPLTGLVTATVEGLLFLFGIRNKGNDNEMIEEEIISMVHEGHEQGLIQESEAQMISNIFAYGDKEAQDIMTHRKNIVAIESVMTLGDAISFMLAGKNSRYPVYEENIDHIIGILHLKDAMRYQAEKGGVHQALKELSGLLREPVFVPQTRNIDELFQEMQKKKLQMVVVIDEYGQTDGLIAMEDILEEIVGNILDEYDEDRAYIEERGKDLYVMEGKTPLEELEKRLGISFEGESFDTLNGFLISRMDKIPEPDEQFEVDYEGYHFKLLSVANKMIESVLVTRLTEPEPDEESPLE
ncbi:MAG: hemolysin family protein [Roseburia sp.]|nr:hemolysin family protein [Roseburia sp.]